jgi:hypothetical protein
VHRFTCVIIIDVPGAIVPGQGPGHGAPGEAIVFAIESRDDSTFGGGPVPTADVTPVLDRMTEGPEAA